LPHSEGERQRRINEAAGRAQEIEMVADATAKALRTVGEAIIGNGGSEAVSLRIAENYLSEFGKLAKASNSLIVPANVSDLASFLAIGKEVLKGRPEAPAPAPAGPGAGLQKK
jgi:regulator of protease activity HflC (stomatin/prohibitin superfamily)